jgi:hypothetical protein
MSSGDEFQNNLSLTSFHQKGQASFGLTSAKAN